MKLQRLGIDVVSTCQLRCVGCSNSTFHRKLQMTAPEDFGRYLSNANASEVGYLKLYNFGEIFLHDDLEGILAQIPRQKWSVKQVEISTNGQVLDKDKLHAVFGSGLITRFGVSCDGNGTPEEYEQLRVGAKWEKLLAFLQLAKWHRDKYSPQTKLFLKVIPTGGTLPWLFFARQYGFSVEWRKWRKAPQSVRFKGVARDVPAGVCKHVRSTRLRAYVDWDGTVVPCCNHPRAAEFGSLAEKSLGSIFKSKQRDSFIKALECRQTVPICCECEAR